MSKSQATKFGIFLLALLIGISACSPSEQPVPTPTRIPPTSTPQPTHTPLHPTETSTPKPLACLAQHGRVEEGALPENPLQKYLIYLPPCYDEKPNVRYPVLYLLHGQTYTDEQWVRLGAADTLDTLILSGEAMPFIIVFPDDRYWNLPLGAGFGDRLVNALIPYIDTTYRTLPERDHRAIGGLSRGAGWAFELGFSRWDLFSVIGLHSLAVFQRDSSDLGYWISDIPPDSLPSVFMDIGSDDQELARAISVEAQFNDIGLPHEWHRYQGAHTEEYWRAHVKEYIQWYAEQWNAP